MKIRLIGPMPTGVGFQVHKAGCRDIARDEQLSGQAGWSTEVETKRQATLEVYGDHYRENGNTGYETYRDDLHFNPCCAILRED